jgi:hypothetical protein
MMTNSVVKIRPVIKEAARNIEVSKLLCTHTHFTDGWFTFGQSLNKKDAPLECTVLLACVMHLLSVQYSDVSKQTTFQERVSTDVEFFGKQGTSSR